MANRVRAAAGVIALSFAASGGFVDSASAATITVRKGADLQAAIDGASSGDTIVVKAGTYAPVSLTGRTGLTIQGRGKVVIDGASAQNCLLLTDCQDIKITGVTFKDSQDAAVRGVSCEHVTLQRCTVLNAGDEGMDFASCRFVTLDRNKIDIADDEGIALSDSSEEQSSDCVVTNNRIRRADDAGIKVNGSDNVVSKNQILDSEGGGVRIEGGARNVVEKNKVMKMDGDGIEVRGAGGNTVGGNIVLKPTGNGVDVESESNVVTGNIVTKAGQAGIEVDSPNNEVTKNRITKSGTFDLRDTTGGTTNTYRANKAKTLDPSTLSNPKK